MTKASGKHTLVSAEPVVGRVLLVDDDATVRRGFARMLTQMGNVVVQVSSGSEALAVVAKQDIDLVLTDIRMPDMDGTTLLESVRESQANLPIILMTGAPELESALKAVRYGAFEYLVKPVDRDALERTVARAVAHRRSAQAIERELAQSRVPSSPSHPAPGRGGWTGQLLAERYRVGRLIGEGGMGAVYEAVREDLGQMLVAIKVLHPAFVGHADLLQRFRREAEIMASLNHANITKVFDFHAEPEGPTFLVMERLRGNTLANALDTTGRLSVSKAIAIASQLLAALSEAHAAGVIHRDLKPENIFLCPMPTMSDLVKVVDFGVAKLLTKTGQQRLTETGLVLGTPPYMAPEYARGNPVDERADIYATGCVMYESLGGQPPFRAENYNALMFAIQEQNPTPLRELRPDVPPELLQVIAKAMARDPDERFASAAEMAQALRPSALGVASDQPEETDEVPIASAPTILAPSSERASRK